MTFGFFQVSSKKMLIRSRKIPHHRIRDASAMAKILQDILKAESMVDREKEHFWR